MSKRSLSWNLRYATYVQKSVAWRLIDHISITRSVQWNLSSRLSPKKLSTWNVKSSAKSLKSISWKNYFRVMIRDWQLVSSSPGNISTGIVRPIDILTAAGQLMPQKGLDEPIVSPISNALYSGYGYNANPGIQWRVGINPNGRVSASVRCTFNVYDKVSNSAKIQWGVIGRTNVKITSLFNIYNEISELAVVEWNIGSGVSGFIRQTSQTRTDFAF
jgi:hypothetical protein